MGIKAKLAEDMKAAMKAKEAEKLSTIRMVSSVIKNKEIEKKGELSDGDIESILSTEIKKRRESSVMYKKGGRDELAQKEDREVLILLAYLPEQLDEVAITKFVEEAISQSGAESAKDMGSVMKILMPKVKGKADGSMVNRIVKEKLGG